MAAAPKTIDALIAEANARGLYLANLFQFVTAVPPYKPSGRWQANFVHATRWYEFGQGDSAAEALEDALERCKGAALPAAPDPFS